MPYKDKAKQAAYQKERYKRLSPEAKQAMSEYAREYKRRNKVKLYQKNKWYINNTVPGFLLSVYYKMKARVEGKVKKTRHLYLGKELLSFNEFKEWALASPSLLPMFNTWVLSGHMLKLRPTVNRIDNTKGYIVTNMEWCTYSENASKANKGHFRGNKYIKGYGY